MRRMSGVVIAARAATVGIAVAAHAAPKQGPPPGLTAYGRMVWNFEGVATQAAGSAYLCEQTSPNRTFNFTRKTCGLPNADINPWQPVFARHPNSTFTLSAIRPPDLGNVAPLQVIGRWVRCTNTTWLVMTGVGIWECTGA
jgi:hypothetical protein